MNSGLFHTVENNCAIIHMYILRYVRYPCTYVMITFVDNTYACVRSIMADVSHDNRVLSLGNRAGLKQSLSTLLDQLGRCQKALNEFLEV